MCNYTMQCFSSHKLWERARTNTYDKMKKGDETYHPLGTQRRRMNVRDKLGALHSERRHKPILYILLMRYKK